MGVLYYIKKDSLGEEEYEPKYFELGKVCDWDLKLIQSEEYIAIKFASPDFEYPEAKKWAKDFIEKINKFLGENWEQNYFIKIVPEWEVPKDEIFGTIYDEDETFSTIT